jgi:hypothetical protein
MILWRNLCFYRFPITIIGELLLIYQYFDSLIDICIVRWNYLMSPLSKDKPVVADFLCKTHPDFYIFGRISVTTHKKIVSYILNSQFPTTRLYLTNSYIIWATSTTSYRIVWIVKKTEPPDETLEQGRNAS